MIMYRDMMTYLPYCLAYICNLSLQEGIFPNEFKIANVIPLFKSDDVMMVNHYRQVSLLCVFIQGVGEITYILRKINNSVFRTIWFQTKTFNLHGVTYSHGQIGKCCRKQRNCSWYIFRLLEGLWYSWPWHTAWETASLWYSWVCLLLVWKLSYT